ncbi:hypothetical protein K504DRAFT_465294, partial [Pleomassaria siparia CBS 279.74]
MTAAFLIVPVPKAAVQKAIDEAYPTLLQKPKLLPLPPTLPFPAGMHPVIAASGLNNDIRQLLLQIDGPLRQSSILVPYVGRGGNSATYFAAPLVSYLAGTDTSTNKYLAGVIPALVATAAGGLTSAIGAFLPTSAAYQYDGLGPDGKQLYSSGAKWLLVPNQVSGPGVYPNAVDVHFSPVSNPALRKYTLAQLKHMINLPYILNSPFNRLSITRCQRNTYFVNNATAQVGFREGRVTFGPAGQGPGVLPGTLQKASPDGVGNYNGVHGFSACAQLVGYNASGAVAQDCEDAARTVDRTAL